MARARGAGGVTAVAVDVNLLPININLLPIKTILAPSHSVRTESPTAVCVRAEAYSIESLLSY